MRTHVAIAGAITLASVAGLHGAGHAAGVETEGAGSVHVWPVQRNIYALFGPGGNSTVSVGDDGVLVVDTMTAEAAPDLLAAIKTISNKPLRWIINTHSHRDHTAGNPIVAKSGAYNATGNTRGGGGASILSFESALMRLNGSAGSPDAVAEAGWPTDSFFVRQKDMFFNGEPVVTMHVPRAHTDGDAIVLLQAFGCDRRRRHLHARSLPGDRRGPGWQHQRHHRRPEPADRARGPRVQRGRRHDDRSGARSHLATRATSATTATWSRSSAIGFRTRREEDDARAGEGRASDVRLRRRLRLAGVYGRYVRRGCVYQQPHGSGNTCPTGPSR